MKNIFNYTLAVLGIATLASCSRELAYYDSIKKLERQAFAEKIDGTRPFVFAMVNDEVYQQNKDAFAERGYELITDANAAWYKLAAYQFSPAKTAAAAPP